MNTAHIPLRALLLCASIVLASCGGGGASVTRPLSLERDISPAVIDPAVKTSTEPNFVINPSPDVAPENKLFVFLPGTAGIPSMYRLVVRSGARRGFHSLGLNYPNPTPVGVLCNNSTDPNCFWNVRREIITGVDYSPLVSVDTADSIVHRIYKALVYLNQNFPSEGWGQYLAGDSVDWSKVIMSGHSQGGGHAGVMAKMYAFDRVVYFASPADWSSNFNAPGAWASLPNVTPLSRQFGFTHVRDPLVPYNELSVIWKTLGLDSLGTAISADTSSLPYFSSHMLTTNATPSNNGVSISPLHGITVIDGATPITANGTPLFDPVWGYLAFQ